MCQCGCVGVFVPHKVSGSNACIRAHTLGLELDSPLTRDDPCYERGVGAQSATETLQSLSSSLSNAAPSLRVLSLSGWLKHDGTLNALLPCMQHLRVSFLK